MQSALGREITLTIDRLAGLGEGCGEWEGRKVFVPYTLAGERIRAVVIQETHEFLHARLMHIEQASPERTEAFCPHFTRCGGCSLQHLASSAYHQFKEKMLLETLRKSGFDSVKPEPLLKIGLNSRRRVDWSVAEVNGAVELGFIQNKSHTVVNINECQVLVPQLQQLIRPLKAALKKLALSAHVQSIQVLFISGALDIGITLAAPYEKKMEAPLIALGNAVGAARLSVFHPEKSIVLFEKNAITRIVDGMKIELPPFCFLQASETAEEHMVKEVTRGMKGCKTIADLFCGIGTYSIPLTLYASVTSVEGVGEMTDYLSHAAEQHDFKRELKVENRDLFKRPLLVHELKAFDGIVINPPRDGAKDQCREIAKSEVKKLVMVSCNPATFARDARTLHEGNYQLTHVLGIDQFAYSSHLEIVAHFSKAL